MWGLRPLVVTSNGEWAIMKDSAELIEICTDICEELGYNLNVGRSQ